MATTAATFYKGETVNFSIEVKGKSDNILTDPSFISITISKESTSVGGTSVIKIDSVNMTKSAVGKYYFNWTSDEVGNYSVTYKAENNSKITISKDAFIVVK